MTLLMPIAARRRRAQTLAALVDVARRVTAGDLSHRVPAVDDDELRDAVDAFNAMVDHLARTRRRLVHDALHDPLTALPNRSLFADRVTHALARARATATRTTALAVLFVDLDGFKQVNDRCGHEAGDALLVAVTARLAAQLRPHDTVARLGGDEFAVLLDDLARPGDAQRIADRLIDAVSAPVSIGGAAVRVGASVGIAPFVSGEPATAEDLLRRADTAMYAAKRAGKGCHRSYEADLAAAAAEQAALEEALRAALDGGELSLAYEPVVDLATRRTAGLQARVRWVHPEHGTVPEERLRALVATSGLAVPLGRWALTHACREVAALHALDTAEEPVALWLSLSARQLLDGNAAADVAAAVRAAGLAPARLVLGVPEALLTDDDHGADALGDLAALGVRLAVDDFGSGTAGLAHLRRVPFSVLRLDPALLCSGPDTTVVRAAVAMGRALDLVVAAGGVERADDAARLRDLGCALATGPLAGGLLPPGALAAQRSTSAGSPVRASAS